MRAPSRTYEYTTPDGDAYVTIAETEGIYWVGAVIGFAGTQVAADAYALGMLAGRAIQSGADRRKVGLSLVGVTHGGTNNLVLTAASTPDAIGKAILKHAEACQAA